ncbi:MAG TPA: hypothetical protein VII49_14465 [Rhizomicrobium sp.]
MVVSIEGVRLMAEQVLNVRLFAHRFHPADGLQYGTRRIGNTCSRKIERMAKPHPAIIPQEILGHPVTH